MDDLDNLFDDDDDDETEGVSDFLKAKKQLCF